MLHGQHGVGELRSKLGVGQPYYLFDRAEHKPVNSNAKTVGRTSSRRIQSTRWLSVPSVTSLWPYDMRRSPSALALALICIPHAPHVKDKRYRADVLAM